MPDQHTEASSISRSLTLRSLMIPVMLEALLRNFIGTMSMIILKNVSEAAVNAVGIANSYLMIAQVFIMVLASGAAVSIGQSLGSGNAYRASRISMVALSYNSALGVLLGVVLAALSAPLLSLMQVDAGTMADARGYLEIVGGGMVFQAISMAAAAILRVYGKPRLPLLIIIVMNVFNLLGAWIVVLRPFETPLYGVTGVAVVMLLSQLIGAALGVFFLWRMQIGLSFKSLRPFPRTELGAILSIGLPMGIEGASYWCAQLLTTSFITALGGAAVSAKIFVQNIVAYVYLIGLSTASAGQVLLSHRIGEQDFSSVQTIYKRCLRLAVATNLGFSIVVYLLRDPLMGIFTSTPEVLRLAQWLLLLDIAAELFRAFNHVSICSLRAAGDVRMAAIVNISLIWICSLGLAYVLAIPCGLGVVGVFIGFALDEMLRGTLLTLRWKSGKWRAIAARRIERLNSQET